MSMNFSEFIRKLGADPLSRAPEFLRARQSSPKFEHVAQAADVFERKLAIAFDVAVPGGLQDDIYAIASQHPRATSSGLFGWKALALAASVLMAVGVVSITWKMDRGWGSVENYLVSHYAQDGATLVALAEGQSADNVQAIMTTFDLEAAPDLINMVGFIKYCPTPDGKGAHMVLNTEQGPITVILMPDTAVTDRKSLTINGVQAYLVTLSRGSAVIMGSGSELVSSMAPMVRKSIFPANTKT